MKFLNSMKWVNSLGVLTLVALTTATFAQSTGNESAAPEQARQRDGQGGRGIDRQIDELTAALALSDEQKAAVKDRLAELRNNLRDARQENAEAFRTAIEKMRAAREGEDQQALTDARQELATLERDVMGPIWKTGTDNLRAVLSADQQIKLDEWLRQRSENAGQWRGRRERNQDGPGGPDGAGGGRGQLGVFSPRNVMAHADALGLSEQQKQDLQAAGQKVREAMRSDDAARVEAIAAYRQQVEATLTPEQLAKLKELEPVRGGRDRSNRRPGNDNTSS